MSPATQNSPIPSEDDETSLENPQTISERPLEGASGSSPNTQSSGSIKPPPLKTTNPYKLNLFKRIARKVNIYLLVFIFLIFISIVIIVISLSAATKNNHTTSINGKPLTASQLEQLASSGSTIGSANQVLNIAANTVFSNQVLARQSFDVAGSLQVGGTLSSAAITATGTSNLQQLATSGLVVNGATTLNGALTVGQSLTVAGTASFNGVVSAKQLNVATLSIQNLQLSGDLTINNHFAIGGSTPTSTPGDVLGSGGTVSLGGSDGAGSININTGSSPDGENGGCFISITFSHPYGSTPYVVITPVGLDGAQIPFYVEVSTSGMSVCTAPSAFLESNQSFQIDYIVLG